MEKFMAAPAHNYHGAAEIHSAAQAEYDRWRRWFSPRV
jgi:hypothetical protein